MIAPDLLAILRCPDDGATLHTTAGALVCDSCGHSYEVVDGIAVMLQSAGDDPEH